MTENTIEKSLKGKFKTGYQARVQSVILGTDGINLDGIGP